MVGPGWNNSHERSGDKQSKRSTLHRTLFLLIFKKMRVLEITRFGFSPPGFPILTLSCGPGLINVRTGNVTVRDALVTSNSGFVFNVYFSGGAGGFVTVNSRWNMYVISVGTPSIERTRSTT